MGFWDKIKGKAKSVSDDFKHEQAYKKAAQSVIDKKAKVAYYQAKEKEAIKFAEQKAGYEREEKLKSLKQRKTNFGKAFTGFSSPNKTIMPMDLFGGKRKPQNNGGVGGINDIFGSIKTPVKKRKKRKKRVYYEYK